MNTGIYKISNNVDNRIYIGSALNYRKRKEMHLRQLKCNNHHNIKLQNFVNKYGIESIFISLIEVCEKEHLIIREQYYIDLTNCVNDGFNILPTAGSWLNKKHTIESRQKMSKPKNKKILSELNNKKHRIPIEIQYTYKKQIGFTETQRKSLQKLEKYDVNVNQFIRQAIAEKIASDWKQIKEQREKIKLPF